MLREYKLFSGEKKSIPFMELYFGFSKRYHVFDLVE